MVNNLSQNNLRLNQQVPVLAKDGITISINDAGMVNVAFFQFRGQQGNDVLGEVVSAIRFQNVEDLKQFSKQIEETIEQHQNREP